MPDGRHPHHPVARLTTATGLLSALLLVTAATPTIAGADPYGYGPHTGTPGLHWILDAPGPDPEHPAVVCSYGRAPGYKLKSMLIRQPVILADVSEGQRTQRVGWRAVIQRRIGSGEWQAYGQTPTAKADATGQVAASFPPRTFTFPNAVGTDAAYRVLYQLTWYAPNGTTKESGAAHRPYWYGVKGSFGVDQACPSTYAPLTSALPAAPAPAGGAYGYGDHEGKRGLHWIMDTYGPDPEYTAVTCEYGAEYLEKLRVRRPMVLARDTGPGTDRQDVAWRAVLQYTLLNSSETDWLTRSATSWSRTSATDTRWAAFQPKTLQVVDTEPAAYRVLIQLRWYKGTTDQILGRATHFPLWYRYDQGDGSYPHQDQCYTSFSG